MDRQVICEGCGEPVLGVTRRTRRFHDGTCRMRAARRLRAQGVTLTPKGRFTTVELGHSEPPSDTHMEGVMEGIHREPEQSLSVTSEVQRDTVTPPDDPSIPDLVPFDEMPDKWRWNDQQASTLRNDPVLYRAWYGRGTRGYEMWLFQRAAGASLAPRRQEQIESMEIPLREAKLSDFRLIVGTLASPSARANE